MSPLRARRGLTFLEVMIASAVLMFITLVVLLASSTVSDASATQGTTLDMDRDAARFLSTLRRELRQSGYEAQTTPLPRVLVTKGNSVTPYLLPDGDGLQFYMRIAPDGAAQPWSPAGPRTWTLPANPLAVNASAIRYRTVPASNGRLEVRREQNIGGSYTSVPVLGNVQSLQFSLPQDANSVGVTLQLVRRGHKAVQGLAPPDVVKTYMDQIEMLNSPAY